MSNKNFAGQKLDGRSFRGQDLRGADFSGCSLKSCDFRDADLSGANFCNAVFGVSSRWVIVKFLIGFSCCFFMGLGSLAFNFIFLDGMLNSSFNKGSYYVYVNEFLIFGLVFVMWLAIRLRRSVLVFLYGTFVAVVFFILSLLGVDASFVAAATVGVAIVAVFLGAAFGVVIVGFGGIFPILLSMGLVLFAVGSSGEGRGYIPRIEHILSGVAEILYVFFGFYVRRKAIIEEDNFLIWYRRWCLAWIGWGGVNFLCAKLIDVNFSWSNLRAASFVGAKIKATNFFQATNLHLACTAGTSISPRWVRVLLVERRLMQLNFSGLDLQGILFSGLKLFGVNFSRTNLSGADFCDCDLRETDLSEATVLGTNFERAQLTGATIDQWNTDKRTCFDGVDCEYVYIKRDKSFKNPPQGTFKAGEFSKLYQEIANTVDFIVHTPEELQALLRAIESIKQQGGEIVIQSLERKNESVVVRTQSPEAIDKAAIYAQVREEMDSQIQLLKSEHEKQLLTQRIELSEKYHEKTMDSMIRMASQFNLPPSITMNNSPIFTNSPITHSAVNLGDHSTVSNNVIEQVADAQLRTDLQKLHDLLTHSTLPAYEKKQAQESVTELAQASDKPAAERKSIARRSLAFLKELREDLGSMADLGVQYGETLARVVLWFQGL